MFFFSSIDLRPFHDIDVFIDIPKQIDYVILEKFARKPAKSIFDYINADDPSTHTKNLRKPT